MGTDPTRPTPPPAPALPPPEALAPVAAPSATLVVSGKLADQESLFRN